MWKFLKEYLHAVKQIEETSPKAVFKACYLHNILPQELVTELNELSEARNTTTHLYDQAAVQEVFLEIKNHHAVLGKILQIIQLPTQRNG
jgi:uncharacterized protein YutE (UPF0331/DUF86 family)